MLLKSYKVKSSEYIFCQRLKSGVSKSIIKSKVENKGTLIKSKYSEMAAPMYNPMPDK